VLPGSRHVRRVRGCRGWSARRISLGGWGSGERAGRPGGTACLLTGECNLAARPFGPSTRWKPFYAIAPDATPPRHAERVRTPPLAVRPVTADRPQGMQPLSIDRPVNRRRRSMAQPATRVPTTLRVPPYPQRAPSGHATGVARHARASRPDRRGTLVGSARSIVGHRSRLSLLSSPRRSRRPGASRGRETRPALEPGGTWKEPGVGSS
jgi:hypothetical protein